MGFAAGAVFRYIGVMDKTHSDSSRRLVDILSVVTISLLVVGIVLVSLSEKLAVENTAGGLDQPNERHAATAANLTSGGDFDANYIIAVPKGYKFSTATVRPKNADGRPHVVDLPKLLVPVGKKASDFQNLTPGDYEADFKSATEEAERANIRSTLTDFLSSGEFDIVQPNYAYKYTWTANDNTARPADWDQTKNWYLALANLDEMYKDQGCPTAPGCGGTKNTLVAVLDSGVAYENYDDRGGFGNLNYIKSPEYDGIALYNNPGEIANNGKDDDCNGVIDDKRGLDAYALATYIYNGYTKTQFCPGGVPKQMSKIFHKGGHGGDVMGHGSYVTGMISGEVENGQGMSPAFNTRILPISGAVSKDNASYAALSSAALIYGLIMSDAYGADVINMSWGGGAVDQLMHTILKDLYRKGIVLVAGSGNDGSNEAFYPAAHPEVISVGTVNPDNTRADYSNFGKNLDITAYLGTVGGFQSTLNCFPICIPQTLDDGTKYDTFLGTSFAAPQVSALAALLKSKYPKAGGSEIKDMILRTAVDVGATGRDNQTGYGVMNFQRALGSNFHSIAHRFYSQTYRRHFYTLAESERLGLMAGDQNWAYEGEAFVAFKTAVNNTSPVYRFWCDSCKAHFFTINAAEKDQLIATNPAWKFEGTAYYAYKTERSGTIPLYRFYSDASKAHFFTANPAERDATKQNPNWKDEGIAFYVKALLK